MCPGDEVNVGRRRAVLLWVGHFSLISSPSTLPVSLHNSWAYLPVVSALASFKPLVTTESGKMFNFFSIVTIPIVKMQICSLRNLCVGGSFYFESFNNMQFNYKGLPILFIKQI